MKNMVIFESRKEIRNEPKNLKPIDSSLFEHEYVLDLKPVLLVVLKDISIIKNFIFSVKAFKVHLSLTHVFKVKSKLILKRAMLLLTPARRLDQGIWITDELSSEYFHWFTDALPRLKVIQSASKNNKILSDNLKANVILPLSYKHKEYVDSSLKLLGYEVFYYNPKKRLKVKNLISSTHTAPTGNYNSDIIRELRASFISNETLPQPSKKIYISRSKANQRKVVNEEEVIALLSSYNYEIHNFEDYSFKQQLDIMYNVKTLISMHGAGLTNMLFMPPDGNIIELRNEGDSHNNCYFSLTTSLNHDYFYLTNKGDTEDTYRVNITVDVSRLKEVLDLLV